MANEELELVPWEQEEDDLELAPWEQPRVTDTQNIPRQADPIVTNPQTMEEQQGATSGDFLGVPTQKGINDQGEPRSYLTPLPMEASGAYNIPVAGPVMRGIEGITGEGSIQRMVGGGVLESIKAPLELAEYLAETVGLDPNDEKYIRESFPTMPANNPAEKAVQEITSMIIGGATGTAVGVRLGGLLGAQGAKFAGPLLQTMAGFKKADPVNANKKFELFVKSLGGAFGEIIGTSATTPSDVQPLSEGLGIVPETDDNFVGNMADNAAFMGGVKGIVTVLKAVGVVGLAKRLTGSITNRGKEPDDQVTRWLQSIDEDITPDLPKEEVQRRGAILADVIKKYSFFDAELSGRKIPIDTTTSMVMGAKDYVRQSYNYLEGSMGAKKFNEFVETKAQDFVQQIAAIKKGLADTTSVSKSDSALASAMGNELETAANRIASPAEGNAAGQSIAEPFTTRINDANEGVQAAKSNVDRAVGERASKYDQNYLMGIFKKAKLKGSFSSNPLLANLTGEELFNAWTKAKTRVDEAFNQIPPQDVDPTELAEVISKASKETNALQDFNIPTSAGGMTPVDDIDELAKLLEANGRTDVSTIIKDIRPKLSKRISAAKDAGDMSVVEQLVVLRDELDLLVNKSGDPTIKGAFDSYKKFSETWHGIKPLADYDTIARTPKDYGNGLQGVENVYKAGEDAFAAARAPNGPGYVQKFVEAFSSEVANGNEQVTKALLAEGLNVAVKSAESGKPMNAEVLWGAIEPQLKTLDATDPATSVKIRDAISNLRMADANMDDMDTALKSAQQAYTDVIEETRRSSARFFIANLTGNGDIATKLETGGGFKELFGHKDGPDIVKQLMEKMDASGDILAKEGVQSEFLRFLQDRYFAGTSIAMDAEGNSIKDASKGALKRAVEGNSSGDVELIKQVFPDNPDVQTAIYQLMELGNLSLNIRGSRPNPFGSNTAMDTTIRQGINALVNFTVGPLNRTGTRLKSAGALLTQGIEESRLAAAREIMGTLSTNPETAIDALKYFAKDPTGLRIPDKIRIYVDNIISGTTRIATDRMGKAFALEQRTTDQQTDEAFDLDSYMDENEFYFDEGGFIKKQGLYSDPNQTTKE